MTSLAALPSGHRRLASFAVASFLAVLAVTSFPSSGVSGIWTTTLSPTADAYVNQATTSTNYGTAQQLYAGATPTMRSYLKFVVPNLGGTVSSATLRIFATEDSAAGFAVRSAGNNWQEGTIAYSGSPNPSATITASSGPLTAGTWTSVDVTPLLKSNATITFALTGTGSPAAALASRESSNPPQLDVAINDTALPAVTVTSPAAGSTTSNSMLTLSGRAGNVFSDSPTVTANVYAGSTATGTPVQTRTVTRSATNWSAPATVPLANGQYTVRAEQQDSAGNTGLSNTRTFTVADNSTPVVTLTQPANGAALTNGTPTFSGAAGVANGDSTLVTVNVYAGSSATGTPLQTLSATRQGSAYSVGVSAPLVSGTYTARAEQQDAAGHTGFSTANTFTVPDLAPPVVTLTQPTDGATLTTAVPTFAGLASALPGDSASVTVRVYAGSSASGTPVQTLTAARQADASYSVNASAPLANGTYTAQAAQQDSGGNTGVSGANTFTISDTDAPVVTLTQPADGTTLTTTTPSFAGAAGAVAGDAASVTVKVYAGSAVGGSPVQTLSATRQGSSYSVNASSALAPGTYTAQAEQQDAGGNTGSSSANTFVVPDLAGPVVTLTQPANGATVSSTTPSFAGVAGNANGDSSLVTVNVYAGASASGTPVQTLTATRQADNSYSVGASAPLADGTYTARAEQQDAAGNTGFSSANTFTVPDLIAPVVTLTQPGAGTTLSTSVPSFAGGAGAATGDSTTVTVKVYAGSTATGTPVQTLSTTRQGTSYSVNASGPLTNGTYTAQAEQQDGSGNTGRSTAITFAISDTTGPAVTLTQPANGATLVTPTPSFSGVAGAAAGDAASVTVNVYSGSSATGTPVQTLTANRQANNSYAVNASPALAEGTYTAQAQQQDASGNTGSSSANTFTISDATAPVVTLTQPANGSTAASATPTFAGVAGNLAGDSSLVTVKVYAGSGTAGTLVQTLSASRQADSSYSVNASAPLSPGTYTAQATQNDAIGNTGTSSANTFTVPDLVAPVVTLTTPANGATVSTQLPTYTGAAGAAAGDSATVTVNVYSGTAATGTPAQTLTATRQADNSYSVTGTTALAVGTYTARAQQQDGGGNTGFSSANTFTIPDVAPPTVTLTGPANGAALTTAVPTFTGVAGAAAGDSATVTVRVYSGSSATGTPVQSLTATRQADNSYTVNANPALANGTYTARAEQQDAVPNTGFSSANTFTISDTTAPAVTLTRPIAGGMSLLRANFAGAAGAAPGDSATMTVRVYAGSSATGTPVRTLTATRAADNTYSVTTTAAAALTAGTYTAQVEQRDAGGNAGLSSANTFSVAKTIVSIGFDDGNGGQWQARPMLAANGIHATFFLNSPLITNNPNYLTWEQIAQLAADGNEIGGHTMYHSFLLQVDTAEATRQICYDRNNLLQHGYPATSFAIPFGEYNATIKGLIKSCGYNSGRSTDSFEGLCPPSCAENVPPADLWATMVVGYGPDGLTTLQDKITAAEQNGGGWVQLLFHDICANCGPNGTTAQTLSDFLNWLGPRTAQSTATATVRQVIGGAVQPAVTPPPLPAAPGATNGIRFAGLERDNDANGIPDCTRQNSWGNHTGTWTRTNDAHAGSWAMRVDATGYGDGADVLETFDDMGYCTPTVIPGRTYRLTTWYKSTGDVRFTVNLRRSDFASPFPWWTESPSFPASATWRQASWVTPPIPVGNNGMLFGLMNTGNGSMTVDDIGIVDANPTAP